MNLLQLVCPIEIANMIFLDSISLFAVIALQSCSAGVENLRTRNRNDTSSAAGMRLATFMLVAGIIGVITTTSKSSKYGGIVSAIFYLMAAFDGFSNLGTFSNLSVWAFISFGFGIVFLIGNLLSKDQYED